MPRLTALLASVFLCAASPVLGAERTFPANEGQITFNTPSENVGCTYTPKGGTSVYEPEGGGPELSCDRVEPSYLRFVLTPGAKAKKISNVGDASCCSIEPVLDYGDSWSHDGFKCVSAKSGLTSTRGKNGFFISKAKTRVY